METHKEFTNKELSYLVSAQAHIRQAEEILDKLGLKDISCELDSLLRKIGDLV